jgi:hypothetical protein
MWGSLPCFLRLIQLQFYRILDWANNLVQIQTWVCTSDLSNTNTRSYVFDFNLLQYTQVGKIYHRLFPMIPRKLRFRLTFFPPASWFYDLHIYFCISKMPLKNFKRLIHKVRNIITSSSFYDNFSDNLEPYQAGIREALSDKRLR